MNLNSVDVLLVEHDAREAKRAIRELKKHTLAKNLVHINDGNEALDFIFASGKYANTRHVLYLPKIVLLDIQAPTLNGIEVLKRIKTDPRSRLLPVVILAASNENPDIKKCYDLGAHSYIVKPVNFGGFAQATKNLSFYWQLMDQILD